MIEDEKEVVRSFFLMFKWSQARFSEQMQNLIGPGLCNSRAPSRCKVSVQVFRVFGKDILLDPFSWSGARGDWRSLSCLQSCWTCSPKKTQTCRSKLDAQRGSFRCLTATISSRGGASMITTTRSFFQVPILYATPFILVNQSSFLAPMPLFACTSLLPRLRDT